MCHQSQNFKKKIIIFWFWRPFWYEKGPIDSYFYNFFRNPRKIIFKSVVYTWYFYFRFGSKIKLFSKATSLVKLEKNRRRAFWEISLSKVALENNFFGIQIKKKVPSMYYRFKDNFTRIWKKNYKDRCQ